MGAVAHAGNLPSGGIVVGGSATISQPSVTQMQITSTTTRSAISWNDFSIGQGYGVNATQPTGGTQLEQVRGTNVSQIFGSLTSNGSIVVANPNGIWFGPQAQVDVAGLAATTAHATDTDIQNFMAGGNLNLSQAGNATAAVVNQGNITISNAGLAAFVAPGVRNDGVIQAKLGTVQLASGTTATLDFYGDGLINIAVTGQTLAQAIDPSTGMPVAAAVQNQGTINADGGTVLLTANVASGVVNNVINTSGVVQARAVSQQGGEIVLDGGSNGTVQVADTLDTSGTGTGQTGGTVNVLGDNVQLASTAVVDVSGDAGGGTALVGGNFHGAGPERNATATTVSRGATILADAVTSNNGGQVAVWADQSTYFDGAISAKGGVRGGNGGFVETSGHQGLTVGNDASIDAAAAAGQAGTWLLDPSDFKISAKGTNGISTTTIDSILNGGTNEIVSTGQNITVVGDSQISWFTGKSLTLQAGGHLNINSSISGAVINGTSASSALILSAGNGSVTINAPVSAGSVSMTASGTGSVIDLATSGTAVTSLGGGQTYSSPVMLSAATILSDTGSGNIAFGKTVDGAYALAVNTAGMTTFGGAVGGTTALASLTTDAPGSTTLAGGAITTTGAQTYNDAVTLGAADTLTSTGSGNIAFGKTVDGTYALTTTTTGAITFGGAVGANTPLAALSAVSNTGTVTVDNVTTAGAQDYYGGGVTLTGNNYTTSNSTIEFYNASRSTLATATLTGSITINNSTTIWGPVLNPKGSTTNMTFSLGGGSANDTTFAGDVGNGTTQRLGAITITGGRNFTIADGATVYVNTFADSGMTGVVDFGATLDTADSANLGGNVTGHVACATGSFQFSCIQFAGQTVGAFNGVPVQLNGLTTGSINGFPIADVALFLASQGTGGDPQDKTVHLYDDEPFEYGQSFGIGDVHS